MFDPEEEKREEQPLSGFQPVEETTAGDFGDEVSAPEAAEETAGAEPESSPVEETAQARPTAEENSGVGSGEEPRTRPDYADAHYEPVNETTVPPRYYTPPQRPVKEHRQKKSKGAGTLLKIACLALVCAMLGGLAGAALTGHRLNQRIDALEESLAENGKSTDTVTQRQQDGGALSLVNSNGEGTMSAAQIYENACRQVVGITTNVTTTNFFGMSSSAAVSGSGFIISEDGYIMTNYHVIEYAVQGNLPVEVMLHDGTKYEARIVGTEQANDIAVLKIEATGLAPASFGDSDELKVGDTVYAVGNPLGELEFSMSTGHVSALDRVITTEEAESINMFQIDAAVNSGNSGGPLYNSRGQVVGVVTAKYKSSGVEGLGFSIPANDASRIAKDLITMGYVTGKAYLGVMLDRNYGVDRYSIAYAQYYNMPLGAYVQDVTSGGAADQAGLRSGDIITALDGEQISNYNDLKNAIKHYSAGDSAELTYNRAGESKTVTITFGEAVPEGVHN